MSLPDFDYRAPTSVDQAVALRQEFGDDALMMAGGLTVVILLRERLVEPRVIISLSGHSGTAPYRAQRAHAAHWRGSHPQRDRALRTGSQCSPAAV